MLKNADFIIETNDELLIVEYKNSLISGAVRPQAFNPTDDKLKDDLARKFYDSLHYLQLRDKMKPKQYIVIIEAAGSDRAMRLRLRDRIIKELPFSLQNNMNTGIRMLDECQVLSIAEWNAHPKYGLYPCIPVNRSDSVNASSYCSQDW